MSYLHPRIFYPCVIALAVLECVMLFAAASAPAAAAAFVAWLAGVWIGLFVREAQVKRAVDKLADKVIQ